MPQLRHMTRTDIPAAVQPLEEVESDTKRPATGVQVCFCTHPVGLHWFNSDRCIDCRCPGFYPVESSVVATLNFLAEKHEEQAPPLISST